MTENRIILLLEVKEIVDHFLAFQESAADCIKKFPLFDPRREPLLNNIFKSIDRYLVDEDIRLKEPAYEEEQLSVVKRLFKELVDNIDDEQG